MQLSRLVIVRVEIVQVGVVQGENCQEWELSRLVIVQVGVVQGGNWELSRVGIFQWELSRVGIVRVGIVRVGIVLDGNFLG